MKPRTLLVLLLLVVGLGAFIWFYERELPSSEERSARARKLLGGLEGDRVVAVEIEGPGGADRVRLERAVPGADGEDAAGAAGPDAAADDEPGLEATPEPEWRLAAPESLAGARADRFAVERLVDRLTGLDKERTLEDADRAEVGLDEPRGRVTLVTEDGGETTVELGAEVPASSSALVGLAGRPEVWVVAGTLASEIDKPAGEWRDRELFPLRRDEIERLELAPAGGERIVLGRRGESFWLEEPIADRAASEAVESLLADLTGLRVTRFVDEPPAAGGDGGVQRGLEPPRAVLVAHPRAGDPVRLELGAAEREVGEGEAAAGAATDAAESALPPAAGAYFARLGDQVFTATAPLRAHLARAPGEWQSKALTGRRLYQIDRVRVEEPGGAEEPGGGELLLRRDGADWRRGEEAIPYSVVSDLLFAVTDARGERPIARSRAAAAGADLGTPTLSLTFEGGDEPAETVSLYPETAGGEVPATVTGRDFVLLLAPSTAETLTDSLRRLREAEPIPEDEAAVDDGIGIEVEEGDGEPPE